MNEQLRHHPLNGLSLEVLLGDLVREYGWDILAEQLPISCFKNYPSFNSSVTFLRKTEWARQRLEDLYLYKFLQYPLPDDDQQTIEPRNRIMGGERIAQSPAKIALGDSEFFAHPVTKRQTAPRRRRTKQKPLTDKGRSADPWGKWRK